MRQGVLAMAVALLTPMLVAASEPVWVFVEPPSAEAERDFQKAEEDAKADIAAGVLKARGGGLFGPDEERQRRLAKFGIEEVEQGCVVIESVYSDTYYAMMKEEIERRYGKDFWTRFNTELEASREKASASGPKRDFVADRKYAVAVANHVVSYWKVPPDVRGGYRCDAVIYFGADLASAETKLEFCYDDDARLEPSVAQAVQASLPLPAEIVALRTPNPVLVTFEIPRDEAAGDIPEWSEWQSIKDFLKQTRDQR